MSADMEQETDPNRVRARRFLTAFALIAALWWVLSGFDPSSWKLGVPAAMVAALLVAWQPGTPDWRIRPWGALRFATFFLDQSARGGLDVALRALRPSLPLAPDFIAYQTRLPRGPGRTFFIAVIGLLPGTLTVHISGHELTVHVLDGTLPITDSLERLEDRVAGLFGLALGGDDRA